MEPTSPNATEASLARPVEVMLFMPAETFGEIHGHASRLGITDAALFTACWLVARGTIESNETVPQLRSRSDGAVNGAVYFSLAAAVRDDVLAFALAHDRSMSWAFVKAWAMVRPQVAALGNAEQFAGWRDASA